MILQEFFSIKQESLMLKKIKHYSKIDFAVYISIYKWFIFWKIIYNFRFNSSSKYSKLR